MSLKKISVQLFSDIHIEMWNKLPEINVDAKYLFLAGDICQLNHPLFFPFFDYCSSRWEKVFYTPGNHEFYSNKKNYNELCFDYKYKIQERYKNIFFLNDESVSLNDDINVYGSIFWTNPNFISTCEAKIYSNDYNCIKYFNKSKNSVVNWDINYVKELSKNMYDSLKTHLEETEKKTIVMTHFPPLREGTSNPKYNKQPDNITTYFSWNDNTTNQLNLQNVPLWMSGHTHWSYDIKKNDCRFISNQLGYKNEIGTTNINVDGIYEIEY
jgi:predicted phosphodiesterase